MPDFVSEFWSWYIIIPTVLGLVFCVVLIWTNGSSKDSAEKDATMGHVWDEDLEEYNNPLPKWWLNMFYITLVFAVVYLILFPGLGNFAGILGWSSTGRYDKEVADAETSFAPLYESYLATPVDQLVQNDDAMGTARRIYSTNCATCHGSDARGATGFPNLRDHAWQYGGDEAALKMTLTNGRRAAMPAWITVLGETGVDEVSEYVYSLTNEPVNPQYLEPGEQKYQAMCAACHGQDAKGNPALGAPNLTDNVWLYGGSLGAIKESLVKGRNGIMPAFNEQLNESEIHLLVAYLNSIGDPKGQ